MLTTLMLTAAVAASNCNAPTGAERLWSDPVTRVLMLGEVHGTNEIPALAEELLCVAGSDGRRATLAIEADPADGQAAIMRYLRSRGRRADQLALRRAPMWRDRHGRGSEAVLRLVERARRLGARVVLFDPVEARSGPTDDAREQAMADVLLRAAQHGRVVALTGMGHADREGFVSLKPMVRSAVMRLPARISVTLGPAAFGGEVWLCRRAEDGADDCGPNTIRRRGVMGRRSIRIAPGERADFDGTYSVGGDFTTSPPAAPAE